eukprot:scaffold24883_cov201-Cylindrotheca_fusiformis.AAC.1
MPGRYFHPSNKVGQSDDGETFVAMEPFLLHHAIGLRNNPDHILQPKGDKCDKEKELLAMGRPLWHAFLNAKSEMNNAALVTYARQKLLQTGKQMSPKDLSSPQMIALLACRACLTISPVSRFAPTLVSSHMGTAVRVSTTMDEVVVAYPSEPILAIASRSFWDQKFLQQALSQMKEYFACGAVDKGHRGEMIVRLLNLLAIDKCMARKQSLVVDVELKDFLAQFDRTNAKLSCVLNRYMAGEQAPSVEEKKVLSSFDIMDKEDDETIRKAYAQYLKQGTVRFTHFVHLARGDGPLITPDLLRYAYCRTAAIVVDPGRRGIDWIIPIRMGDDKYIGLVGQDKNRLGETLEGLSKNDNETTHHKVTASYFLSSKERQLFIEAQI